MNPLPIRPRQALAVLLVTGAAAAAADISIDYDPEGRIGEYETFAFRLDAGGTLEAVNPALHEQILEQLRGKLGEFDLREARGEPELWVLYKVAVEEAVVMHTTYDYGYADSWTRWGSGPDWGTKVVQPSSRESSYTKGTLVIDLVDAETETLLWRAMATDAVADKPRVNARRVRRAINGIARRWKQIRDRALAADG